MVRKMLWPFGLLFMFLAWVRGKLYDWGILSVRILPEPVLSVGNLTTGGTGKTPWVQKITDYFQQQNYKVTILSRGYSGDYDGVLEVTPDMDPRRCGDEPLWLRQNTTAHVFVGRNRYQAGLVASEKYSHDLFVLDDGFQHRKLQRQLDLVLLDASAPRRHYYPLPVGYLREGFLALRRAQLVLINKCNYADPQQLNWLQEKCRAYCSPDQIFHADFVFSHWRPLVTNLPRTEPRLPMSMTCGLGNPEAFIKTLEAQGIAPVRKFIFPDHYYWKPDDIERITYQMKQEGSTDLLITDKDAVKLQRYKKHFFEMNIQLWVCEMKVQIQEREEDFWQTLASTIR